MTNKITKKLSEFANKYGYLVSLVIYLTGSGYVKSPDDTRLFEFSDIEEFYNIDVTKL